MRDAAVGFQCPDCIKEASKNSRQNRALYGGERSADPRMTSYVLIGINLVVWMMITATGGRVSRIGDLLALKPRGQCTSAASPDQYFPSIDSAAGLSAGPERSRAPHRHRASRRRQ